MLLSVAEVAMDLEKFRNAIQARGMKHRWLAAEIGIHPSTLCRFLKGRTMLGGEALIKLLQVLNLDPEALKKKAS